MNDLNVDLTHNLPEFTVSEISQALKRTIEQSYTRVRVRGEISGYTRASSGHRYMALKDENAILDAVCWRGISLGVEPEDGLEVIISGRLTTYPGRSKYQIVVEAMEVAGKGALLKLLEERRKKLSNEGLFDEDRKKEIVYLPDVIGVVTSPTGAVILDILHRLRERFPRRVLLWPVSVQGDEAARQIASAIEGFNGLKGNTIPCPDILIVARGGGSFEDLWPFNEEVVVRAVASSSIPVISAVGHESDVTLIDFVADRRAPTPTAAAEIAVPVRVELVTRIMDEGGRLLLGTSRIFSEKRAELAGLSRGLPNLVDLVGANTQRLDSASERLSLVMRGRTRLLSQEVATLGAGLINPRQRIVIIWQRLTESGHILELAYKQHLSLKISKFDGVENRLLRIKLRKIVDDSQIQLEDLIQRFQEATQQYLQALHNTIFQQASLLDSLSFKRVLERGYVVVRDSRGRPMFRGEDAKENNLLTLQFVDKSVEAIVMSSKKSIRRRKYSGGTKHKINPNSDLQQKLL